MNEQQNKFEDSLPKFHRSGQALTGRLGFWILIGAVAVFAIAIPAFLVREFSVHTAPDAPFKELVRGVGGGNALNPAVRSSGSGNPGPGSDSGGAFAQRQQLEFPLIQGPRVVARRNDNNFVVAIPAAVAQGGMQPQAVVADPRMYLAAPNDTARSPGAPIETFSILTGPIQTAPVTPGPVEAVPFRYPRAVPGTALSNIDDNNLQAPGSR